MRIRALVNAELIAENEKGEEKTMPIGSGTYFEAKAVETYEDEGETYANITLLDGFKLNGVVWNSLTFENHGVPQVNHKVNPLKPSAYTVPGHDKVPDRSFVLPEPGDILISKEKASANFEKLKELNEKEPKRS